MPVAPRLEDLPENGWQSDLFPDISKNDVMLYLQKFGSYTKNYCTGVQLCQSNHLFAIQSTRKDNGEVVVCAKCHPTMRKVPPFYQLTVFINIQGTSTQSPAPILVGAICSCPAGESQSCVHVAALLFTLVEISPTACTSLQCVWSRTACTSGRQTKASSLDFGVASFEGYYQYNGPKLNVSALLDSLSEANIHDAAALVYGHNEEERITRATTTMQHQENTSGIPSFINPLRRLQNLQKQPSDFTTVELINVLTPCSKEEVALIESMTTGQRLNPLGLDARQWRLTDSNFGCICNRKRAEGYFPHSLIKKIMGDYGMASGPAIQWGITNETVALEAYELLTKRTIQNCGVFISLEHPYLAASPDAVGIEESTRFIVEVKCPYKHKDDMIREACSDKDVCLQIMESGIQLKRSHDYYFQVMGQLAVTGANYCHILVWTLKDRHLEEISFDAELWTTMLKKLKDFYHFHLGPEVISRLANQ